MTSEQSGQDPNGAQPGGQSVSRYQLTGPKQPPAAKPSAWRREARFLGAAFAVAAAVIALGLRFAPEVTAYAGLGPWVFAALLGFLLVLAGACVLFGASLPGARYPASPGSAPPAAQTAPPERGLTILGSVLGVVGLALAALAVVLAVMLPGPTQRIMVQFTDLSGRVQLEYCPTLPGSFAGTASQSDLVGSTTILPVRVEAQTCGNPEYTDDVWIYLNRRSVTVSDQP